MVGKSKDKKKEKLEAEKPSDESKTKKSDSKKKGKDGNVADDGEGKVKRSDQIKICIGVLPGSSSKIRNARQLSTWRFHSGRSRVSGLILAVTDSITCVSNA